MEKRTFTAVILAAGSGTRMGKSVKKQYIELKGKPLIYYTIKAFEESPVNDIVLVVPSGDVSYCKKNIVDKYGFKKVSSVIEGGKERYDSVYAALTETDSDYVLIHDGARAFVDAKTIEWCMKDALVYGSSVCGVPSKDTVKIINEFGTVSETPERSKVWIIQTPQCFETDELWDAYDKMMDETTEADRAGITDDAMVMEEFSGIPVHMTYGSYSNIKITTPEDLIVAEQIINGRS